MSLFTWIAVFGYLFGIDLLLWGFYIWTALTFLDFFVPIPIIDKAVFLTIEFTLAIILIIRFFDQQFIGLTDTLTNPFIASFIITMIVLFIGYKIYNKTKKGKKK